MVSVPLESLSFFSTPAWLAPPLQLIVSVQLQPHVAVALYLEGGVFVRLDADVLEGHVRGLPPPPI